LKFGYKTPKFEDEEEAQMTVPKSLKFGYKTPKMPMRLKTRRA
jgi:hypothetical protein